MDSIEENAQTSLPSIHLNIDSVSAWDRIGTSGWKIENEENCISNLKSTMPFFSQSNPTHTTTVRDKMISYYTLELEAFVEEKYADDLNNPFFYVDPIQLFPGTYDY